MSDEDKRIELQLRRLQLGLSRERAEKRARFGEELVRVINAATSRGLELDEFQLRQFHREIDWPRDIRDASGLVLAYVDRSTALGAMKCVANELGPVSGSLGYHEKDYLGFAAVESLDVSRMVDIAEQAEDSALFHVCTLDLVILVDCYGNIDEERFSVVIQGGEVLSRLVPCFLAGRPEFQASFQSRAQ